MAKKVSFPTSNLALSESNDSDQHLVIAQFKNGNVHPSGKSKLRFSVYKNKDKGCKRILTASNNRLCYMGSNFETDVSKITSSILKVCVLNKKRGTLKLYDTDFFQLKPQLKCPEIVNMKDDKTYMEKSSDLALAFGSKMQKKKISSNMKYGSSSTNSNSVDIVTKISETIEDIPNVARSNGSCTSFVIPPQNSSATNVDEVYNIYDIISKEEFDSLDSEAQVFLDVKRDTIQLWKKENIYPDFIIQFMENNATSMNIYKAKLLCYMNYMHYFLKTTYADWKRKNPVPDVPEPFRQKLMESFTINRSMPVRLKDKLLAYAVVLGLKLNNNVVNCNIFTSSLKIPFKRMTSIAYALGCHVSGNKTDGTKIIHLKLPLYMFQTLSKKRKNN